MTHFLTKAFGAAHASFKHIEYAYDLANLTAMRLMLDESFLDINEARLPSPKLHGAATAYNKLKDMGQSKLSDRLEQMQASGDLGPKPDIKKPLIGLAQIVLPKIGMNMNVSYVAVMGLTTATLVVASYAMTSGHTGALPDFLLGYLGLKPNGSPAPKL